MKKPMKHGATHDKGKVRVAAYSRTMPEGKGNTGRMRPSPAKRGKMTKQDYPDSGD